MTISTAAGNSTDSLTSSLNAEHLRQRLEQLEGEERVLDLAAPLVEPTGHPLEGLALIDDDVLGDRQPLRSFW